MIFSFILITLPTIILTIIISNNLDFRIICLQLIILFYFYIVSNYSLFMAGTSDPGIFERKYEYINFLFLRL